MNFITVYKDYYSSPQHFLCIKRTELYSPVQIIICYSVIPYLLQLSLFTIECGTIIFVAIRFGFSIWLINCEAASMPNWNEFTSTDVKGGWVNFANRESLKEMIDTSSGIESPH